MTVAGALLGLGAGLGAWLAVAAAPVARRPRIGPRCDRYLDRRGRRSAGAPLTPFPTLEHVLAPVVRDVAAAVDRRLGGRDGLALRLARSGRSTTVEEYRVEQVMWAAAGLAVAVAVCLAALARGRALPLPIMLIGCAAGALGGALLRDQRLAGDVMTRERRMTEEFPAIADLLAFSVAAGESVPGALTRVVRVTRGELAGELDVALSDVRLGLPLDVALRDVAARTGLPVVARFVDGMVVALQRGTPMAEVLRAQAADARAAAQRSLMETAGRKEIAMLVPVVFLVLPMVVLVALFPGFYGLVLTTP